MYDISRVVLLYLILSSSTTAAENAFYLLESNARSIQQWLINNSSHSSHTRQYHLYFDTRKQYYANKNGFVRYQVTEVIKKKQNLNKVIQLLSQDKITDFASKHYQKIKSPIEKHPLFSLLKRDQHKIFINKIKQDGLVYPLQLKPIIHVAQIIDTYTINRQIIKYYRVDIETIGIKIKTNYIEVFNKPKDINKKLFALLKNKKRAIKSEINSEYAVIMRSVEQHIKHFNLRWQHKYWINLSLIATLALAAGLLFLLLNKVTGNSGNNKTNLKTDCC